MKGEHIDMLCTKFGENRNKGKGTVAKTLKLTFDLGVTLTFDLSKIQYHVIISRTLKRIPTKFGENKAKNSCLNFGLDDAH